MSDFNSLFLSPSWLKEYHTKYPHGLSVMENLIDWVNQVNELIDYVNITPDKVKIVLEEMNLDGTLDALIDQVLFTSKADLSDLNSRGVNVLTLGLKNDGLTDNALTFETVLASHVGKTLFFPAGIYRFSTTAYIPSNTHLQGTQGTIFKLDDTTDSIILGGDRWLRSQNKDSITIENIHFDGGLNQVDPFWAISLLDCTNIQLRNLTGQNFYGGFARLNGADGFHVENINIKEVTGIAGMPGEVFYGSNIKNGIFRNIVGENIGDHIFYLLGDALGECKNIIISGVIGNNTGANGLTSGAMIVLYNNVHDVQISDVLSIDCKSGYQISAQSDSLINPRNIQMNNVKVINPALNGLYAEAASGSKISGLNITNIEIINPGQDGVSLRDCEDSQISGVIVRDAGRYGIETRSSNRINFSQVMLDGFTSYGMRIGDIDKPCTNFLISNVNICNGDYAGVQTVDVGTINIQLTSGIMTGNAAGDVLGSQGATPAIKYSIIS